MTRHRLLPRTLPALLGAALLAASLAPSTGCRSAPPPPPAPIAEEHVAEGLNETFLAEDLDVERFTKVFEGESREIAASKDAILGALHLRPGLDVADVGAGTGLFTGPMAAAVAPDGTVYAVDISPKFIEHLRERARAEGHANVVPVLCTERSVELPPASIDLAFVCDTYHHFEYPRNTLASIAYALRPGGELVVVDFERIPGLSREWVLDHVRAGKEVFRAEIEAAGFRFVEEVEIPGLEENYFLRFRRP